MMGTSSKSSKMRTFCIVLLILLVLLGYLLITFGITETKRIAEGKSLYEEVGGTAPKCWIPERKALFSVGCPVLTDEVRTELAIILSSCICEAKGLPDVVCEKSKLGFCHQHRNCLYECGMKYGIHVSVPRIGYNVFERMFETIPFMCKYILESNNFHPPNDGFDWDLFKEILLSNKHGSHEEYSHILARPMDYAVPHLRNLEHLTLERLSQKDSVYHFRYFRDHVRNWIGSPEFGYTLLLGILLFLILYWLFETFTCK